MVFSQWSLRSQVLRPHYNNIDKVEGVVMTKLTLSVYNNLLVSYSRPGWSRLSGNGTTLLQSVLPPPPPASNNTPAPALIVSPTTSLAVLGERGQFTFDKETRDWWMLVARLLIDFTSLAAPALSLQYSSQ